MDDINIKDDEDLISEIMSDLSKEIEAEQQETTDENTEEVKEEVVEDKTKENAEVESKDGEENGEDKTTVESKPNSKNEVNKIEGFKALKGKLKEKDKIIEEKDGLIAKLMGKTKSDEETTTKKPDALEELGKLFDKTPEEIKEAIEAKKAKEEGMSVEQYKKFVEMQKQIDEINAEKKSSESKNTKIKLAESIDEFISATGLSSEEEVIKFFETAKKDFGVDLSSNPNSKTMITLWNGMSTEAKAKAIEQDVLLKIKNGEVPTPNNQVDEKEAIKQAKKQKEDDEKEYKMFAEIANRGF